MFTSAYQTRHAKERWTQVHSTFDYDLWSSSIIARNTDAALITNMLPRVFVYVLESSSAAPDHSPHADEQQAEHNEPALADRLLVSASRPQLHHGARRWPWRGASRFTGI
ncbi:MAG: hypothetical protein M3R24_22415 [Chloroflexota bacterium]|nr:hypothetical protein [Chloroflexota bacterium]